MTQLQARVRELERAARQAPQSNGAVDIDALVASATRAAGAAVLAAAVRAADGQALLEIVDRLKGKLGDAAIVLGAAGEGRVDLVASVAPALVERGVRAGEIIQIAAARVGGGGGGRDTLARAGGRDPAQLDGGAQRRARGDRGGAELKQLMRVLALDYGSARCGCAVSDPTGVLATPLEPVASPASRRGLGRLRALVAELGVRAGGRRAAAVAVRRATPRRRPRRARSRRRSSARCRCRSSCTTSASRPALAERSGGHASEDSRAAAHLLEGWLARRQALETARG